MIHQMAYLPERFQPIGTPLIRVGCPNDGGYVVAKDAVHQATHLLSFGLEANWAFEFDFLDLKEDIPEFTGIDGYDPTLTSWLLLKRSVRHYGRMLRGKDVGHDETWFAYRKLFLSANVNHHRKWIGKSDSGDTVDLNDTLARVPPDAKVFLKMDIEGSEYEILDQLASANSSFSGIAVELHSFDEAHLEYADLFNDLHRYFKVAHVHVNNSGPLDSRGCPTVVEVSYIHNRLVASQAQSPAWQPDNKLDQPNCLKLPDFQVCFRAA